MDNFNFNRDFFEGCAALGDKDGAALAWALIRYGYTGEELDVSQMLLDDLFLNLPAFSKCSEDCKGLCPVCGCDLNTVQCSCVREKEKENPFSALEQLLYHDKEV